MSSQKYSIVSQICAIRLYSRFMRIILTKELLPFFQELQESKKDSVALSMWSGAAVTKPGSKLLCETRVEGVANKDAGVDIDEENNQDGSPNWRFWRALPFWYGCFFI